MENGVVEREYFFLEVIFELIPKSTEKSDFWVESWIMLLWQDVVPHLNLFHS